MNDPLSYNAAILERFAGDLYRRGKRAVTVYTLAGFAFGVVLASVLGAILAKREPDAEVIAFVVLVVVGGTWIGRAQGLRVVLASYIEAQRALWAVHIERTIAKLEARQSSGTLSL